MPRAARNSLPDTAAADPDSRTPAIGIIRKRADFLAANRGKRFVTPGFILLVRHRSDHDAAIRYGLTVSKKVGNAVKRNRMKRRFRALIANTLPQLGMAGCDHILIGRPQREEPAFDALRADLEKGLRHIARKRAQSEAVR